MNSYKYLKHHPLSPPFLKYCLRLLRVARHPRGGQRIWWPASSLLLPEEPFKQPLFSSPKPPASGMVSNEYSTLPQLQRRHVVFQTQ